LRDVGKGTTASYFSSTEKKKDLVIKKEEGGLFYFHFGEKKGCLGDLIESKRKRVIHLADTSPSWEKEGGGKQEIFKRRGMVSTFLGEGKDSSSAEGSSTLLFRICRGKNSPRVGDAERKKDDGTWESSYYYRKGKGGHAPLPTEGGKKDFSLSWVRRGRTNSFPII